jgi:predicted NBD/HSP70 family sugar kinase
VDVMAARLAMSVAPELVVVDGPRGRKIEADRMRPKLEAKFKECLARAKNFDAIQQAPKRQVPGRFLRARMGGSVGLRRLN